MLLFGWHLAGSICNRNAAPASLVLALFRRLLLPLGQREALCLFPAPCAFPNIVSTFAVSHNAQQSPTCRAVAMRRRIRRPFQALSLLPGKKHCAVKLNTVEQGRKIDRLAPLICSSALSRYLATPKWRIPSRRLCENTDLQRKKRRKLCSGCVFRARPMSRESHFVSAGP